MSRRTSSRGRSKSDAEAVADVPAVITAGPKLTVAAEFQPPAAAAELPQLDIEHQPRRRATK